MSEEVNLSEVIKEVKNANEEELKQVVEQHFEVVRTAGMKVGATYISAAIYGVINKHIKTAEKPSLRDYKRCMDDILKVISVQLTPQNDSDAQEESV